MSINTRIAAAIVAAISAPTLVHAQQEPTAAARGGSNLDTVVVTGSAIGGVKKLEASYNIVTANEEQIATPIRRAPPIC